MIKTNTYKTFNGNSASVTFELVKHNQGHTSEWDAILIIAQNGKSTQNKWGGFPVRNSGKPAYIQRIWKAVA